MEDYLEISACPAGSQSRRPALSPAPSPAISPDLSHDIGLQSNKPEIYKIIYIQIYYYILHIQLKFWIDVGRKFWSYVVLEGCKRTYVLNNFQSKAIFKNRLCVTIMSINFTYLLSNLIMITFLVDNK